MERPRINYEIRHDNTEKVFTPRKFSAARKFFTRRLSLKKDVLRGKYLEMVWVDGKVKKASELDDFGDQGKMLLLYTKNI